MLPWLLDFLHRYFQPQTPPSHPLYPSLHSQQQPSPWDCSTNPKFQLPATVLPGDLCSCQGYLWLKQGLSDSLSTYPAAQTSCFTPSLKCFSSVSDNCPDVGIGPLLQFSHPLSSVLVLQILLFFSHLFFLPPEFCEVPYILSHWSGTPVSSQLVFCMHFWVSRCISDVSMVRDVLHIYLFLHHLLLPQFFIS